MKRASGRRTVEPSSPLLEAEDDELSLLYVMDDSSISPSDNVIKRRRRLTCTESHSLNAAFVVNPQPSATERKTIARNLGMAERAVQIWFQNRRAKQRRDDAAGTEPSLVFSRTQTSPSLTSSSFLSSAAPPPPFDLGLGGCSIEDDSLGQLPSPPSSVTSSGSVSGSGGKTASTTRALNGSAADFDGFLQDVFSQWISDDQALMFSASSLMSPTPNH